MFVCLSEVGELHVLRQAFDLSVGQHDELLVGGRVNVEPITLLLEDLLHAHSHLDGMFGELEVEVVRKQGLELQTDEGTFGYHGSVLFLDREEVLVGLTIGEDHSLTTKSTNLRSTNIEHITVACQIG